jgi:hypothetical protein
MMRPAYARYSDVGSVRRKEPAGHFAAAVCFLCRPPIALRRLGISPPPAAACGQRSSLGLGQPAYDAATRRLFTWAGCASAGFPVWSPRRGEQSAQALPLDRINEALGECPHGEPAAGAGTAVIAIEAAAQ